MDRNECIKFMLWINLNVPLNDGKSKLKALLRLLSFAEAWIIRIHWLNQSRDASSAEIKSKGKIKSYFDTICIQHMNSICCPLMWQHRLLESRHGVHKN